MSGQEKAVDEKPSPMEETPARPQEKNANIETLLFDLDGTLYPLTNGYFARVRKNMWRFMEEKLRIEPPAEKVWRPLFNEYNQTVKALRVGGGYKFDTDEFWSDVRAGSSEFFTDAPDGVKAALEKLPQDKYVFTNCNEKEAEEVLGLLNIRHHFKGVYGAKWMGDTCKPDPKAFHSVLEDIGADPTKTAMFEDSFKNLVTAKSLGMSTIFVRAETAEEEGVGEAHLATVDGVVDAVSESELRAQALWLWP